MTLVYRDIQKILAGDLTLQIDGFPKQLNELMSAFDGYIVHLSEHECSNTVLVLPDVELEGIIDQYESRF